MYGNLYYQKVMENLNNNPHTHAMEADGGGGIWTRDFLTCDFVLATLLIS